MTLATCVAPKISFQGLACVSVSYQHLKRMPANTPRGKLDKWGRGGGVIRAPSALLAAALVYM